jgi:hypothetical protein
VRNAVADRVDVDEGVVGDPALEAPLSDGQASRRQTAKLAPFLASESSPRALVCSAMLALVGLEHPGPEVIFERAEGT